MGEALEILLKGLAVVPPRLTIDTGRCVPLQLEVGKNRSMSIRWMSEPTFLPPTDVAQVTLPNGCA